MQPRTLVLRAPGINRDGDAVQAIEAAGGTAERVHVNAILAGDIHLRDYAMLIIPGGFSYGDHLGAGKLLAVDLALRLADQIRAFVDDGRPVLGICNGFQVLVKSGVLPGIAPGGSDETPLATLTDNESQRFECRWVHLAPEASSQCVFTKNLPERMEIPIAHGEGRFVARDEAALAHLEANGQIALRYVGTNGTAAYPANPNGSVGNIAGICNPQGNVLGLMPHPEDAIRPTQHPAWTREPWRTQGDGLALFRNAVRYAKEC